jgi:hypothetical protein
VVFPEPIIPPITHRVLFDGGLDFKMSAVSSRNPFLIFVKDRLTIPQAIRTNPNIGIIKNSVIIIYKQKLADLQSRNLLIK